MERQNSVRRANGTNNDNTSSTEESKKSNQPNALMKIKTYLTALRPWSLSASLVPTILGEYPMTVPG